MDSKQKFLASIARAALQGSAQQSSECGQPEQTLPRPALQQPEGRSTPGVSPQHEDTSDALKQTHGESATGLATGLNQPASPDNENTSDPKPGAISRPILEQLLKEQEARMVEQFSSAVGRLLDDKIAELELKFEAMLERKLQEKESSNQVE